MPLYVYVSGGSGAKSVYDPVSGARLTKAMIRSLLKPYGIVVQQHANKSTDIIVVPNGVARASYTSSKGSDWRNVQVMNWTPFLRRHVGKYTLGKPAKRRGTRSRPVAMRRPGLLVSSIRVCSRCGGAAPRED